MVPEVILRVIPSTRTTLPISWGGFYGRWKFIQKVWLVRWFWVINWYQPKGFFWEWISDLTHVFDLIGNTWKHRFLESFHILRGSWRIATGIYVNQPSSGKGQLCFATGVSHIEPAFLIIIGSSWEIHQNASKVHLTVKQTTASRPTYNYCV